MCCGRLQAEPLSVYNNRLFVGATVNEVPVEALLDSGAEATLIDRALARRIGLPAGTKITLKGSGGTQEAEVVEGVTISSLGKVLPKLDIVVLDLSEVSQRLVHRPTAMVLGRELFDAARIEINFRSRQIRLVDAGSSPAGEQLPLTKEHGVESFPARASGQVVQATFDLGNGSSVLVSRGLAARLRLEPKGKASGGGLGGGIVRTTVVLPSLKVAGRTFRRVPAQIDALPNASELNVGTSILRNFLITTDFRQRAIWLAPAEGTTP